jgi:hypothetical protein
MSDSFVSRRTTSNANDAKEERVLEIDRRISEIDALFGKRQDAGGKKDHPRVLSESEMLYWADRHQERNSLLAERYRLTKKTA